jgi:hypothetical protein
LTPTVKRVSKPLQRRMASPAAAKPAAASPASAAAAAPAQPSTGEQKTRSFTMSEITAVIIIQRMIRAKAGRERARARRFWKAWNAIDNREEADLVHTNPKFEKLKNVYGEAVPSASRQASVQYPVSARAHAWGAASACS